MAERVNVFEKVVLDMKATKLSVELKSMSWHLFEKSNMTLERKEPGGPLKVNTISPPFEEHLSNSFSTE